MKNRSVDKRVWWQWKIGRKLWRCIDNPIFVVGTGRSGTTVLCEMLDRHSNILIARGEAPILHKLGMLAFEHQRGRKAEYYQHNMALKGEDFRESLRAFCFCCIWGRRLPLGLMPSPTKVRDVRASSAKPVRVWGAKAFPDEYSAEGLIFLYPNAKFIYVYRNGMDVIR